MTKRLTSINPARRRFIQGCTFAVSGLAVEAIGFSIAAPGTSQNEITPPIQVVIYQDKAHFDNSGLLSPYQGPVNVSSATKDYVQSIDEHEFLCRHWFV